MSTNYKFETLQVHAGQEVDKSTNSGQFLSTKQLPMSLMMHNMADLFALSSVISIRLMNPTTDVFEKRVAALEGGVSAGNIFRQSAQFLAINNIVQAGDNFVSTPYLCSGTYNQFKVCSSDWALKYGLHPMTTC